MTTGTLLLLEQTRASPRSNWVMERSSVRVSFSTSCTVLASSGSRFRMILFLELLMIARPYLPSSRPKKSERSCVAEIAAPPKPRIVLKIVRQNSAAMRLELAPISCQISSIMMAFFLVRSAFTVSQT